MFVETNMRSYIVGATGRSPLPYELSIPFEMIMKTIEKKSPRRHGEHGERIKKQNDNYKAGQRPRGVD